MKDHTVIFEKGEHKWVVVHASSEMKEARNFIDTNEYIVCNGQKAIVTDPGGMADYPDTIGRIADVVNVDTLDTVFVSHQDPDIFSSLSLWLKINPELKIMIPRIWIGFMTHFGGKVENFDLLPDDGSTIDLNGLSLQAIPAHHCHSSGNLHLFDPLAKILFCGDVGAAMLPPDKRMLFVDDFESHIQYIEKFHRRWFGSNTHKNQWCDTVRNLDIEMLCPQHGAIYRGQQAKDFISWFQDLKVGQF